MGTDGAVLAETAQASLSLGTRTLSLTLKVTGHDDSVDRDVVQVTVRPSSDLLLTEGFDDPASLIAWRIIDEGEMGGLGFDGLRSDWTLSQDRLVQDSDP
jgi:hypothetical protein